MPFVRNCFIIICLFAIFSTTHAQNKDKPRQGEGIHAFLRRHNRGDRVYYQEFIKLNKGKFGKKNALLSGIFYVLPPIAEDSKKPDLPKKQDAQDVQSVPDESDTLDVQVSEISEEANVIEPQSVKNQNSKPGYQPLFGLQYARYPIVDNELKGACFFLSSGHGGPDCGAIAKVDGRELHEDEYAYDITLRLARNLLQHGATVYVIIQDSKDGIRDGKYLTNSRRETCMGAPIPLNQAARLRQRTTKINALSRQSKEKYQRAVFLHLDSRSKKHQLDVFFYYQNKPDNREKSKRLTETMRQTFEDRYAKSQPGRGFSGTVSTRNLAVMRNAQPVSIFMELANMQNAFDQRRYILDSNRQALANWMTLGFIRDYKNSKK
jgi:N-acetylmuramoyl-L-alanine amidase